MSLSKKGLRKITVGDDTYNWTIRKRLTSGQLYSHKKLTAAIEIVTEEKKRGLLLVDFGVSPPRNMPNPHHTAVTPKTIETVIRKALKEGWNPRESGTREMLFPIKFVPHPNAKYEVEKYDTRWDEVVQNMPRPYDEESSEESA